MSGWDRPKTSLTFLILKKKKDKMASGQNKFGPSTYSYETQKRKRRIIATIHRGEIDGTKWSELSKIIEKINDEEDHEVLNVLENNEKECLIEFRLEDDVCDHTDLKGWMEDVEFQLFNQTNSFDISSVPEELMYKKEDLQEGMEICIVELRSSLSMKHITFLPFKNEIDMHKNMKIFENFWAHGLTVTLDKVWIDKLTRS